MPEIKKKWVSNLETLQRLNLKRKEKLRSINKTASPDFKGSTSSTVAKIENNRGPSSNELMFKKLIQEAMRDFFNDPRNRRRVTEYLEQFKDQKKPQSSVALRDISNMEILRPRDLPQATGLSRTNIFRLEKAGKFVKKLQLSAGAVGYDAASVRQWVANRQKMKGE